MTLRARLAVAGILFVLAPLAILALYLRGEASRRLTESYRTRIDAAARAADDALDGAAAELDARLRAFAGWLADDNDFRLATVAGASDVDVGSTASRVMPLLGVDGLLVVDESGRVVSSGHFPAEAGTRAAWADAAASVPPPGALVEARRADGPFLVLVRADSVRIGARRFRLLAGRAVDAPFLASLVRASDVAATVTAPGLLVTSDPSAIRSGAVDALEASYLLRRRPLRLLRPASAGPADASLLITSPRAPLRAAGRLVDRAFLVAFLVVAAGTAIVVLWGASAVTRPLRDLALRTDALDLERRDVHLPVGRPDEVGALARTIAALSVRLRGRARALADAERRAALGELARQVNHDVKNGLVPIRNAFRYLRETAARDPGATADAVENRAPAIEGSVEYLESLAARYARLSPPRERSAVDLVDLARRAAAGFGDGARVRVGVEAPADPVRLAGDAVSLRRILENLIRNAVESVGDAGAVTVRVEAIATGGRRSARLTVLDTGPGIPEDLMPKLFQDFVTTKPDGVGLGLATVRRLVGDHRGSVRAERAPGGGAAFVVEFPMEDS